MAMHADDALVLWLVAFFTVVLPAGVLFGLPFARHWARRLERKDHGVEPELQEELQQVRSRLLELEERADFTERLLARERQLEHPADAQEGR